MPTEKETLFLKTCEDIEKRLNEKDPYEILYISALIRKLFFDDFPLVDQTNKNYRTKIIFEIIKPQIYIPGTPKPSFFSVQDGLDPETSRPGKKIVRLKRDEFFKTPILLANDKEYSIRETILFEANIMGGVHPGFPKTDKEKTLKKMEGIFIGGYRSSLRQLKAIARIMLKALKPLRNEINV